MFASIKLRQKIRHWRINAALPNSSVNVWLAFIIGALVGVTSGFACGYYFPRPVQIVEVEKHDKIEAKQVEFDNRLRINQQAQSRLNEINADLREKYNFLLGQLTLAEETVGNKSTPYLKHLLINELNEGVYQYQVLVINQAHSQNSEYYLDFSFTSGESEKIKLDVGNFSFASSKSGVAENKKTVIPFLGKIEARKRQLKKTSFTIEENKKTLFMTETIYEGK